MSFELEKKMVLAKADKSRKGTPDEPIKPILKLINNHPDYYTTSSCSGRIVLLQTTPKAKRHETGWLLVKHGKTTFKEVKNALAKARPGSDVWFKQEGAILHIACKTRTAAEKMLKAVREAGFKRAGIISPQRNIIEVSSTESLASPVASNGKMIAGEGYLKELVKVANKLMARNSKRLSKLLTKLTCCLNQTIF